MNLDAFLLKVRRREGPVFDFLYRLPGRFRRLRVPDALLPAYHPLGRGWAVLAFLWRSVSVKAWYEPAFRSRCRTVGPGFHFVKLQQGLPYMSGKLNIHLGCNVTVHSRSSFASASAFDEPEFSVGDDTYLGPGLSVAVGRDVSIGSHCLIGSNVVIADNDGHPLDPLERAAHRPLPKESFKPVRIGDYVWIGEGSSILKGVTLGDGSVVGARSVVTRDVEPLTIVAGNPARPVGKVDSPAFVQLITNTAGDA